ncbi:MAG: histidinol-phosphatase HisJ family protein [Clostridia bacterium]|nr:histidinol-phosphatase HisJ family protein [Clostridia bacterium]
MTTDCDLHTHTSYSDGTNSVMQMAEAAMHKGLRTLGISDHAPVPWANDWCIDPARVKEEGEEIARVREGLGDKLTLLWGVELDMCSQRDDTPYDYVIGSTHELLLSDTHRSVDESEKTMLSTVREYFGGDYYAYTKAYFDTLAGWAQRDIDILGHVDIVTKFNEGGKHFDENDPRYLRPAEDAIAAIAARGHIFELNSGAVSRGYRKSVYPSMQLLRMIRDHGGRILLSSDAHAGGDIAFLFDDMEERAKACGFTHVMTPSGKGRSFIEKKLI